MSSRDRFLATALLCVGMLFVAQAARGDVTTSNPLLPPDTGAYLTPDQVHAMYHGAGLAAKLEGVTHKPFVHPGGPGQDGVTRTDDPAGNETEQFNSQANGMVTVNGNGPFPIQLTGPVTTEVFGKAGNTTGTFSTEMLQLDLSGPSPFGPVMIRESPTKQSLGQTSITDIGGGMFRISSFFDVFTELSVDGGASWIPSDSSTHVYLQPEPIPEPATIMVWSGLALIGFGATYLRRRKLAG